MRRLPLALALAALLAAAGCGGDSDEPDDGVEAVPTLTDAIPDPQDGPDVTIPVEPPAPDPDDDDGDGPGAGVDPDEPTDHVPDDSPRRNRDCGDVAFTPNSDDGAFQINVVGASCDIARGVARAARRQEGLAYRAQGFRCNGERREGEALPTVEWICVRGSDALVVFQTG